MIQEIIVRRTRGINQPEWKYTAILRTTTKDSVSGISAYGSTEVEALTNLKSDPQFETKFTDGTPVITDKGIIQLEDKATPDKRIY